MYTSFVLVFLCMIVYLTYTFGPQESSLVISLFLRPLNSLYFYSQMDPDKIFPIFKLYSGFFFFSFLSSIFFGNHYFHISLTTTNSVNYTASKTHFTFFFIDWPYFWNKTVSLPCITTFKKKRSFTLLRFLKTYPCIRVCLTHTPPT